MNIIDSGLQYIREYVMELGYLISFHQTRNSRCGLILLKLLFADSKWMATPMVEYRRFISTKYYSTCASLHNVFGVYSIIRFYLPSVNVVFICCGLNSIDSS